MNGDKRYMTVKDVHTYSVFSYIGLLITTRFYTIYM